jgi:hypothetical protein
MKKRELIAGTGDFSSVLPGKKRRENGKEKKKWELTGTDNIGSGTDHMVPHRPLSLSGFGFYRTGK